MQRIALIAALVAVMPATLLAQEQQQKKVMTSSFLTVSDGQQFIQQVSGECGTTGCCDTGCCDSGCCGDGCGECGPFWAHRHKVFGEFLYLTAREQHLDFVTPVDGATATAVPQGRTHVLDPGYELGWKVGAGLAIDRCTSVTLE